MTVTIVGAVTYCTTLPQEKTNITWKAEFGNARLVALVFIEVLMLAVPILTTHSLVDFCGGGAVPSVAQRSCKTFDMELQPNDSSDIVLIVS